MLKPEYIRDMNYNYMVFKGNESSTSSYGVKMLLNNTISGIVRMELRWIDSLNLYYYDITSLKSISTVYDKESLSYDAIKNLMEGILNIIKRGSEYLLSENDYILAPEYIFIDTKENIRLCHMVGLQDDIFVQITKLLEYLLNKIDYKEEEAVLLVYALYKESRELNTTFDKLHEIVKKQFHNEIRVKKIALVDNKEGLESSQNKELSTSDNTIHRKFCNTVVNGRGLKDGDINRNKSRKNSYKIEPNSSMLKPKGNLTNVMKILKNIIEKPFQKVKNEKTNKSNVKTTGYEIENQREYQYYGGKNFFLVGVSLLGGIVCFVLGLSAKLFQNSMGTGLDPVKLLSCIVVFICLEVYFASKLFDPKNKQTKYVTLLEYEEPESSENTGLFLQTQQTLVKNETEAYANGYESAVLKESYVDSDKETVVLWQDKEDKEDMEKTEILADLNQSKHYYIVPMPQHSDFSEQGKGEPAKTEVSQDKTEIKITPFCIGKQDKGNHLLIKQSTISRKHAVITRDGDKLYLTDLHSTNGTFVNEKKLPANQPFVITEYDEIKFSNISYRIEISNN